MKLACVTVAHQLCSFGTPSVPLDMGLVAEIVRVAGVPCMLDVGPRVRTIWAEPRRLDDRTCWTVQAVQQRRDPADIRLGPAADDGPGMRVRPGCDERGLAALIVVQALRVDPLQPLTGEEVRSAGLAGCVR